MIDEKLFQMLISFVIAPLVGFCIKVVFDRISRNEQGIKELKQDMEDKYQSRELAKVQHEHSNDLMTEIRNELKRINEKLDKKADK
ncbi:hypothetical protein BMT54_01300 [Pasteurellaceae bacterium 15-036681]|nr:hypothetical protein BMT54_01300 [Pasteurellaceae bacterium 15-036681]